MTTPKKGHYIGYTKEYLEKQDVKQKGGNKVAELKEKVAELERRVAALEDASDA
ncbi:MAG TPA: hypothetical protein VHX20_06230 [Terracidiphilus sp.]|jgi:polyhydroxyalkanoate synthesis regulator phasin|nr:hypothetical protein [Terracidiphilus sp.]